MIFFFYLSGDSKMDNNTDIQETLNAVVDDVYMQYSELRDDVEHKVEAIREYMEKTGYFLGRYPYFRKILNTARSSALPLLRINPVEADEEQARETARAVLEDLFTTLGCHTVLTASESDAELNQRHHAFVLKLYRFQKKQRKLDSGFPISLMTKGTIVEWKVGRASDRGGRCTIDHVIQNGPMSYCVKSVELHPDPCYDNEMRPYGFNVGHITKVISHKNGIVKPAWSYGEPTLKYFLERDSSCKKGHYNISAMPAALSWICHDLGLRVGIGEAVDYIAMAAFVSTLRLGTVIDNAWFSTSLVSKKKLRRIVRQRLNTFKITKKKQIALEEQYQAEEMEREYAHDNEDD
jgi:hypothetical protein